MKKRHGRFAALRRGLTLLEVVVALVIFMVGVLALYQLIQAGTSRAARVDLKSQASLRCQSKLDEVLVALSRSRLPIINPTPMSPVGNGAWWPWKSWTVFTRCR